MKSVNIIYKPATLGGTRGWSYEIRTLDGRVIGAGWSAGRKSDAEQDARSHRAITGKAA